MSWWKRNEYVFFYPGIDVPIRIKAYSMEGARAKLRDQAIRHVSKAQGGFGLMARVNVEAFDRELSKYVGYEVAK